MDARTARRVLQCWPVTAAGAMGRRSGLRPPLGSGTTRAGVTILGGVKAPLDRTVAARYHKTALTGLAANAAAVSSDARLGNHADAPDGSRDPHTRRTHRAQGWSRLMSTAADEREAGRGAIDMHGIDIHDAQSGVTVTAAFGLPKPAEPEPIGLV